MKQKNTTKTAEHAKELKQRKIIKDLRQKENWMKWALIAALIIILLLLLFIGYATDWMAGLRKDSSVTPVSSTLDSSKQNAGSETQGTSDDANSGTTPSGSSTQTNNSGTGRTSNTGTTSTSDTSRSSTSTNTTTNNSTTTNNTTTPTTPATPPAGLLSLYADSSIGTSINDIINRATSLGISTACDEGLLVKECKFTIGEFTITTKNLLGTGLVTSILKNF